ncbi:MAG: PD40 domain-containing protein [Myxococcales bacterium]|nr:PD40 domain-containing protein [Myxococcales bacterium]
MRMMPAQARRLVLVPVLAGLGGLGSGACVLGNPNYNDGEATSSASASTSASTVSAGATGQGSASSTSAGTSTSGGVGESDSEGSASATTSDSGASASASGTTTTTGASASTTAAATEGSTSDSGTTTGNVDACDLSPGAWSIGPIEALNVLNSAYGESDPALLSDGLTLFFASNRPGVQGLYDSFRATRPAFGEPFGAPVDNEATYGWNSNFDESKVELRGDKLEVILSSDFMSPTHELWRGTRDALEESFFPLEVMPALSGHPDADLDPHISDDGYRLYFARRNAGQLDIMVSSRGSLDEPFGAPDGISELNTAVSEASPSLSDDERRIFFARLVGGQIDIYTAWRDEKNMAFGAPEPVDALNTLGADAEPYIAEVDGECELFFVSDRQDGSWDIFRAPIVSP